jgi:hypothetical protein
MRDRLVVGSHKKKPLSVSSAFATLILLGRMEPAAFQFIRETGVEVRSGGGDTNDTPTSQVSRQCLLPRPFILHLSQEVNYGTGMHT